MSRLLQVISRLTPAARRIGTIKSRPSAFFSVSLLTSDLRPLTAFFSPLPPSSPCCYDAGAGLIRRAMDAMSGREEGTSWRRNRGSVVDWTPCSAAATPETATVNGQTHVAVEVIEQSPFQPRKGFDHDELGPRSRHQDARHLAAVGGAEVGDRFELVAGEQPSGPRAAGLACGAGPVVNFNDQEASRRRWSRISSGRT